MLIVDAQTHRWNAGNPTTPWHRQIPAYTKAAALREMDASGVDAAELTPHTPWDPKANELAIEAARQHPDRFVILGNFPVEKPESRTLADTWTQRPGMLGLRFTFPPPHQSAWLTDGTVDWLWPAAERAGLPIALMAAGFLPKVAEIAQAASELEADPRPPRSAVGRHGESAGPMDEYPRGGRARAIPQRRDEGHRGAELLRARLPVRGHPRQSAPAL